MRIVIESTGQIVALDGVPCRLWKGEDARGNPYDVFVHRVGTADPFSQEILDKELASVEAPKEIA